MKKNLELKMYVEGEAASSVTALNNLRSIIDNGRLTDQCELHIVDVLKDYRTALKDEVMVTPTLVRTLPLPEKRVIGDLSNREKVMSALGLVPVE